MARSGRWTVEGCVGELRRLGVASVPFGAAALEPLAELFSKLPVKEMFDRQSGDAYQVNGATLVVAHTAVTNRMRWFWACDEATLNLFEAAAESCLSVLGKAAESPVMLFSACFVVVLGAELSLDEVSRHMDWGHPRIQQGEAFTCLTPLARFPSSVGGLHVWPLDGSRDYVHTYGMGSHAAIDGKLYHRTEPFQYRRDDSELDVCEAYESEGHLRVLVSLSIASAEERLAKYTQKVMRAMAPAAALVRTNPHVFFDSESDPMTSDVVDSDCDSEEDAGVRSIATVLQVGVWHGARHAAHGWDDAVPLSVDLAFDLDGGDVYSHGRNVGVVENSLGAWHATIRVEQADGDLVLNGEFVRGPASVYVQGRYQKSGGPEGFFAIQPPKPWFVELELWSEFPLPRKAIGLPSDPQLVRLCWTDSAGESHVAVGRAARWNVAIEGAGSREASAEADCLALGVAVPLSSQCSQAELDLLVQGSVAVVPDVAQRRGTFERLLAALEAAGCEAVVVVQGGRPRLPRPARARPPCAPRVRCYTVSFPLSGRARPSSLVGAELCVRVGA